MTLQSGFREWLQNDSLKTENLENKTETTGFFLPKIPEPKRPENASLEEISSFYGRRNSDAASVLKSVMDESDLNDDVGNKLFGGTHRSKKFLADAIKSKKQMIGRKGFSLKKIDKLLNEAKMKDNKSSDDNEEGPRIFSARRPVSQTHNILKTAGLSYERGHPVFRKPSNQDSRNNFRIDHVPQPSLSRQLIPRADRRGAASALDYVKRSEADLHEQKRKVSNAWWDSSSLKALDLDQHHKEGRERGEINIVLPHLCQAKSSLTSTISVSPELGIMSVSDTSILVDTAKGQNVITTSTVKLNAEAKHILCQIERTFADRFFIDMRKHDIPVRLVGEAVLLQAALEQKSRRNAHLLCTPVRAIAIRKEIKLPSFQGRLMHNMMQKTRYQEPASFDHLNFHYRRRQDVDADEFPPSCARSRRTVFRSHILMN